MRTTILLLLTSVYILCASKSIAADGGASSASYEIAYASFAPLNRHVYVADADGNNARLLLPGAQIDYDPSLSRDGRWVVFTSERNGSANIYRVHPDGTGLEALTDDPAFDDQAALSPDGKSLAFVSTRRIGQRLDHGFGIETTSRCDAGYRWQFPAGLVTGWTDDRIHFESRFDKAEVSFRHRSFDRDLRCGFGRFGTQAAYTRERLSRQSLVV